MNEVRHCWLLLLVWVAFSPVRLIGADDQPADLVSYLAAQGYRTMPVKTSKQNRQFLKAKINGQDVLFTVDTGSSRTTVTRAYADKIHLDVDETSMFSMSVGGRVKGWVGVAPVKSFTLENIEINRPEKIHVMPKGADLDSTCDGLFGCDYMHSNSVVLPVGGTYFWFKPSGNPAESMDTYLLKMGFRPAAMTYGKTGLQLQSHLNGQPFNAVVDCGAPNSTFNADFVKKTCGLDIQPMPYPIHGVDGRKTDGFFFTSKALFFGTLRIPPTKLVACRAPIFAYSKMDALLGYDFLAAHQAIIDFGQNVIWMR